LITLILILKMIANWCYWVW